MDYRIRLAICLVLAFAAIRPAGAQTVYGPDGMFLFPSAFVPPSGSLGLNASYFKQNSDEGNTEWVPITLTYGIANRAEVGGILFHHGGGPLKIHVHLGAFGKYQLVPDSDSHPAVAVTAGFLSADERQNFAAGVISHRFKSSGRTVLIAHVGAQWATTPGSAGGFEDTGAFAGLELPVGKGFRLVAEGGTRLSFEHAPASAVGVMWTSPQGINVGIGMVNAGRSGSNEFFIGVGYPLGGGR